MNDQKRRIIALEDALVQKTKEYERALASEQAKHRDEIKELLNHSNPHSNSNCRRGSESTGWQRSSFVGKCSTEMLEYPKARTTQQDLVKLLLRCRLQVLKYR